MAWLDWPTVHSGNVVNKDCAELFSAGSAIGASDLSYSVDSTNTYVDIPAVADSVDVFAVIVKGGPAYNVYEAAELGDLAWLDLHSPLVSSGKPAQISHWFACGGKETTTTTTPANVAVAADEDDLASTGFNGGWLVVLAAILLLAGGVAARLAAAYDA